MTRALPSVLAAAGTGKARLYTAQADPPELISRLREDGTSNAQCGVGVRRSRVDAQRPAGTGRAAHMPHPSNQLVKEPAGSGEVDKTATWQLGADKLKGMVPTAAACMPRGKALARKNQLLGCTSVADGAHSSGHLLSTFAATLPVPVTGMPCTACRDGSKERRNAVKEAPRWAVQGPLAPEQAVQLPAKDDP